MNRLMILKLLLLGSLITIVGALLKGHDLLTGVALSLLLVLVALKITFAILARRRGSSPNDEDSGMAGKPVPRPPGRRPPALSVAEPMR
jgi:hypothetical protein